MLGRRPLTPRDPNRRAGVPMTCARPLSAALLSSLLLVALAGCPAAPDATPDAGDTPDAGPVPDAGSAPDAGTAEAGLAADAFAEAAVEVYCGAVVRCSPAGLARFPNVGVCRDYLARVGFGGGSTFDSPDALEASIAAGRIQYDPVKGATCLAEATALGCDDFFARSPLALPACRAALVGTVAADGACIAHAACADGLFCSRPTEEARCEGTCAAIGAGRCDADAHCPAGQRCVHDWQVGNHCAAPSTAGAPCNVDEACAAGLHCPYAEGGSTCRALPAVGELCSGACVAGSTCALAPGAAESRCTRTPVAGDPCVDASCADGFWCDLDASEQGLCRARAASGEPCTASSCAAGLVCVGAPATCRPVAALGEPCVDDTHCGAYRAVTLAFCEPGSDTCALLPDVGEPCAALTRFGAPVLACNPVRGWCDESVAAPVCRAFKSHGRSCASGAECGGELLGGECVGLPASCFVVTPEICEP